jgi:hypothetical protein
MCGLTAVFSKRGNGFNNEQRNAFATLLLIDTLRGEDSTGTFMVRKNGDVDVIKEASTGPEFLKTSEWKKMHSDAWNHGAALIGHNRKATRGNIVDENAHPFIVDDQIVLVHNGGIWGEHKKHADVEVDSHAIAHLLHEHDTVEDALGQFHGAYALIWYDVEKEEVNIIRNKERPLWWMETDDAWIWASEKCMLMFTAARCDLKIKQGPHLLEEDSLNTYKLQQGGGWKISNRKAFPKRTWPVADPKGDDPQSQVFGGAAWNDYVQKMKEEAGDHPIDSGDLNEDVPFDRANPNSKLDTPFHFTVGSNEWEKTSRFEKEMAKGCNKFITMGEFNNEVVASYPFGEKILCRCFEYVDDGEGGYYLYASPVDDPDVIVRHHFDKKSKPDQTRMLHMSVNEWLVKVVIGPKSWSPNSSINENNPAQVGYCVITSNGLTIAEGGPYKNGQRKDVAYDC